ncbi:phosphoglycerate kinase [Peptoniphilus equinus]|uniref:Phosphoglycerate kinase n=1 Tax=Peptoniphilus equinus TaxID=3016343 RepID=A0ABY7QSQ4_9FIRM|nr:phosphoglycerate kinase [Peptoniphilus equinus]WBW49819.1 phosphoglycerate kinase [Peptoniphilus equinus]
MKRTINDLDLKGKRALIRVDYNVPMNDGHIESDARIVASLPTIQKALDGGAAVVLMSHLGRPKGKANPQFSLEPVAEHLATLLNRPVQFIASDTVVSDDVVAAVATMKPGDVALLENTRFNPGEEACDEAFSKDLAQLGDVFINDAFGTSHRAHASNVGVSRYLPSALGLLVDKEVAYIGDATEHPKRPFVAILGGAKVSDKIGVIDHLLDKVDSIVIVGAMANTFIKAEGYEVGKSLVEDDKLDLARSLMTKAKDKGVGMLLPEDFVVAADMKADAPTETVDRDSIPQDKAAFDIGEKSIEAIKALLTTAKTVVWNGPAGVFEMDNFSKGTMAIAHALAELEDAITIVGGGDSLAAIEKSGLESHITHVSTGGGTSLEMLEGKSLPGIDAIEEA